MLVGGKIIHLLLKVPPFKLKTEIEITINTYNIRHLNSVSKEFFV